PHHWEKRRPQLLQRRPSLRHVWLPAPRAEGAQKALPTYGQLEEIYSDACGFLSGGHAGGSFPGLTIPPRSSRRHGEIVVAGSLRRTYLTVSVNMADHCDTITLISVGSPHWIYSTSILMMRADDPQKRLHNQALHTNCV